MGIQLTLLLFYHLAFSLQHAVRAGAAGADSPVVLDDDETESEEEDVGEEGAFAGVGRPHPDEHFDLQVGTMPCACKSFFHRLGLSPTFLLLPFRFIRDLMS